MLKGPVPYAFLYPDYPLWSVRARIFGCIYFVHSLSPGLGKLSPHAEKCVFVRYSRSQRAMSVIVLLVVRSTYLLM